jgi:microcin C transport system substrate-binding protein
MNRRLLAAIAALALFFSAAGAAAGEARHGLSAFGTLKYPADFRHFDYVNPDAPKGGTLALIPSRGGTSFDSLNAFILEGDAPQGLDTAEPRSLVYDSLMTRAWDEPDAVYGLVAESAELAPDGTWVTFTLRPEARWHDGEPITADDVVFTFRALKEQGHPQYAVLLADVTKAEALGPRKVRYRFDPKGALRDLPMKVAELPILSKAYYQAHDFTKVSLDKPLASGPYRIGKVAPGRSITYERVKDYWGKDLPVNVGRMNFDRIRYEYYRDRDVGMEAFLAGGYDFREEFTSKTWATEYTGPAMERGWIVRDELDDNRPSGAQMFFVNLRRDKFTDPRVRRALDLAFDFEWTNRAIFYGAYSRTSSIFENSELEADGLPDDRQTALLEPFRKQLPAAVFGPAYSPPESDGSGANRRNLRQAALLLRQAGYSVDDGVLQRDGKPLAIELLNFEPQFVRVFQPYVRNLERLGIKATIRTVDSAQYVRRVKEFDFDLTTTRLSMPLTPGIEQRNLWSSRAAGTLGSFNYAGISSPAVDAMLQHIADAKDRPSLVAACRALDRVLMHGHYMVPQWYKGSHTIAWWDKFGHPAAKPSYARGVVDLWWYDREKAGALAAAREKR